MFEMNDGRIDRDDVKLTVETVLGVNLLADTELKTVVDERITGEEIGFIDLVTTVALAKRFNDMRLLRDAFVCIAKKSPANKDAKSVEDLKVDFPAIKRLMKELIDNDFTESELDDMVKAADVDNSGTIEIDEFVSFLQGTEQDTLDEIEQLLKSLDMPAV